MYDLEYLPAAKRDMVEIVRYVGVELQNRVAAEHLAQELIDAAESVLSFPYATPVYQPVRPLKHEYRKLVVQNYLIFYWINEVKKLVTVARVVYANAIRDDS